MTAATKLTPEACAIHRAHRPLPLICEHHHIVPQAWQQTPAGKLIDPRTIVLCPTAHRNVHQWIMMLMHRRAGEDPHAYRFVLPHSRERSVAFMALTRAKEAGLSLTALQARGQWGQA